MIEKDDWRLLNDTEYLQKQCMNPVEGAIIVQNLPTISQCIFCWDKVEKDILNRWYLPLDNSCCICHKCFQDFKELYRWRLLDGWDFEG